MLRYLRISAVSSLLACGGAAELARSIPDLADLGPYDTAAQVLGDLGEPCRRCPLLDGTEAWDYCGRPCPPPGISDECLLRCTPECPRGWTFYVLSGVVVRYELWGP